MLQRLAGGHSMNSLQHNKLVWRSLAEQNGFKYSRPTCCVLMHCCFHHCSQLRQTTMQELPEPKACLEPDDGLLFAVCMKHSGKDYFWFTIWF